MENNNVQNAPVVQLLSDTIPEPIVDVTVGGTYKGYAPIGTPTDSPKWRITRTSTTGTVTIVEYAQGLMDFSSIWDDRASYDYSR